jgi:hypothetical protein
LRKKTKKWQRAREACHHLLHFKKCRRWWQTWRLPTHCHLLGFFPSVSSLVASPIDASPRFFLNYELTDYIATWCISWVFVISLTTSPFDASPRFLWSH